MKKFSWVKPGGLLSVVLALAVAIGLFSVGITAEVPVGAVRGHIIMGDQKVGLPKADVVFYRKTQDGWEGQDTWRAETDENGDFDFRGLPTGVYSASVFGKVHRIESHALMVTEGKTTTMDLTAPRSPDSLSLNAGSRVFKPNEEIVIRVNGSTLANKLSVKVLKVEEESFTNNQNLQDFLYGVVTNRNRQLPEKLATMRKLRDVSDDLKTKDIEGVFVHESKLDSLPYGVYLVQAEVGGQSAFTWLTVTDIALVTKTEIKRGQAFVCDIETGEPIQDADVSLARNGKQESVGGTNTDGLVSFAPVASDERMTLVSAQRGEARAYTWYYKPYVEGTKVTSHFVTDRPIYRPGDIAHFKATLRQGDPGAYKIPVGQAAEVRVYNPNGDVIKTVAGKVNEWGSIDGEVQLNTTDLQGSYNVEIESGGQTEYGYIGLASYRKPQFEIKVTPKSPEVVRGDELEFTIQCTSFTGEPIVGAKVQADLFKGYDYWSSPFDEEYYEYEDSGYGLEYDRQYEVVTNENGEATVRIDTKRVSGNGEYADFADTNFRLEANVSDEAGRYFSAEGTATAKRGEFDLATEFDRYVANPGVGVQLNIKESVIQGKSGPTQAQVSFGREIYANEGYTFVEESKQSVSFASAEASAAFSPKKSGNYKAIVTARDSRGNEVKSESYLWVTGSEDGSADRVMSLALDKRDYKVGDTAQVIIRAGSIGGAVWFTAEGEGILVSKIVRLTGSEAIVEVPITQDFAPNFTVSVCRVADKEFTETQRGAKVGLDDHELKVTITPDRKEMHPGETVNMLVSTQDLQGKPVSADVALRVVDEGIYQIREDDEDPLSTFYPRRYTVVSTNYSFPSIYLDGEDKGGSEVAIRKDFADTAYWSASVRTGETGSITVPVKVPDNLTTWRVTGSAISKETQVGRGVSSVVSLKKLMLRMSLPQFLTQDDAQDVAITITNSTDSEMAVAYELETTGLTFEGDKRGTVTVPARSREVVTRRVQVSGVGKATLKMIGRGGAFSDGLEMSVNIQPRTELRRDYFAGSMDSSKNYATSMVLESQAVTGDLEITLSPSPFAAMEPMLDDLIDYPYGCVEQTMSRFVPAVLIRKYWNDTGRPRPELNSKIDEAINRGFSRLRELQLPDGGFGWFAYDQPDPRMMTLVLDGLYRIRAAGVSGTDSIIERTLKASADVLTKADITTPEKRSRYISLASAHARYQTTPGVLRVLDGSLDKVDAESLARISLAYSYLSGRDSGRATDYKAKGQAAWKALLAEGTITSISAGFGDARIDSAAIQAALVYDVGGELASKLVNQLIKSRNPRGWGDTWRTSEALKAAVEYVQVKGFTPAIGAATAELNGQVVAQANWSGSGDRSKSIKIPLNQLKSGANEIEVKFAGTGQLQYAMELNQGVYAQSSQPQAAPPTFRIQREYLPMQARRLEDGSMRLLTSMRSSEEFKSGDVFRCRLTITTDTPLEYVAVEDPIPSNCRIVDADSPEPGFDWANWWSNSTFGDAKAAFFIWNLEKGEHVIEYAVRAEAPGTANALPAKAYPMYMRDVLATTGQSRAVVKP
ncbi:MAG: MG2 domain-containing protein [Fimbriimonadaceae bacterium]